MAVLLILFACGLVYLVHALNESIDETADYIYDDDEKWYE